MGTLLRYPHEVHNEKDYFDDVQDVKVTKICSAWPRHIVEHKSALIGRSVPAFAARRSPRRRPAATSST